MGTEQLNTKKVDLVRYILNEADEYLVQKIMDILTDKTISKPKSLSKHFGKLKRGIDGLTYQKQVRDEWD